MESVYLAEVQWKSSPTVLRYGPACETKWSPQAGLVGFGTLHAGSIITCR